ncbi:MAG: alternative ribosome rescue factor ArfA [Alphaproteobacteria bacterium]|jgi:stalled ribosome alternative rescue factor ArfA
MKPRNSMARRLADTLFHQRRLKPKKGKGSFRRRPKHKATDGGLLLSAPLLLA